MLIALPAIHLSDDWFGFELEVFDIKYGEEKKPNKKTLFFN